VGQSILWRVSVEAILETLRNGDHGLAMRLNALVRRSALARGVAGVLAEWLAVVEVVLMLALACAGRPRSALRMLAGVVLVYLTSEVLGAAWRRGRPFARLVEVHALASHAEGRSFPSRHVASGVAMATIAQHTHPLLGTSMAWVALLLGLSRVAAGLHYPSDVLAGALIGRLAGRLLRA
jgi:membrane-associated phospholipid phosphatase